MRGSALSPGRRIFDGSDPFAWSQKIDYPIRKKDSIAPLLLGFFLQASVMNLGNLAHVMIHFVIYRGLSHVVSSFFWVSKGFVIEAKIKVSVT